MSALTPSSPLNGAVDTNTPPAPLSSGSNSSSAEAGFRIGVAAVVILALVVFLFIYIWRRRKRRMAVSHLQGHVSLHSSAILPSHKYDYAPAPLLPPCPSPGLLGGNAANPLEGSSHLHPRSFSYEELRTATKSFSASELLGRGAFGSVYQGKLPGDGTLVAVKRIAENSQQGVKEYTAEVTIISDLRHRNLVRLRGWCHDQGKFLLVYEYMPNGSLDYILFNDSQCSKLSWERRYAVATGLGSALQYLHEECDSVIIHRDIKSSNVLLDESFNAKLGDFGLSRQVDQGKTSYTTNPAGTQGYMAPECLLGQGKATRESDVYAFGAVLLELVCGKRAIAIDVREHNVLLVDWVWHLYSQGKVMEAVDKRLGGAESYEKEAAKRMLLVGLLCSNPDPKARPATRRALEALRGTGPMPSVPLLKPPLSFGLPPPPMTTSQIME